MPEQHTDPESLMPPPIWNPPQFDRPELMMIREVFARTNFPGSTCAAIGRFLEKCDKHIANADEGGCGPMPMMGESKVN